MKKIFALVFFFTKSMLKERATTVFTILALFFIFISLSLSGTNIGFRYKLFEDILLTSQAYLFLISSIFYAFTILNKNINMGLFVLPISAGISRFSYLLTLFLSLASITGVIFIIFLLLDGVFLFFIEGEVVFAVLWQLFLYFLISVLVSSLIIALSNFVSLTNSIIYSISLFMIGSALDEFYLYLNFIAKDTISAPFAGVFYYILPNFSIFDFQSAIVNRAPLEIYDFFILPILYFVIWIAIFFVLAYTKFKNKALIVGR